MYLRIFINIFLLAILVLLQIGFISGLPSWFANINLVLVVIILMMGFYDFKIALTWAIVSGAIMDMYAFSGFGINIVGLVLSLFATSFLLENFLTNRSLYTFLALTLVASILFELLSFAALYIHKVFYSESLHIHFSLSFWVDEISKLAGNLILVFLLFYLLSFFSKRFRPMFLSK